jgi:hypothetical protein
MHGVSYSSEHKAQNHEKILSVATRSFRERGVASASAWQAIWSVVKEFLPDLGRVITAYGRELIYVPCSNGSDTAIWSRRGGI